MLIQPAVALGVQSTRKPTPAPTETRPMPAPSVTQTETTKVQQTAAPATQTTTQRTVSPKAGQTKVVKPAPVRPVPVPPTNVGSAAGVTYNATPRQVESASAVNVRAIARQEALEPARDVPSEIKAINPPKERPEMHHTTPILGLAGGATSTGLNTNIGPVEAPPASATGPSPGPKKTFKGEFLSGTTIPPDTMGAVGTNFVVTSSNDRLRIQTRDGVELSRVTINSFWSTATVKGVAVASAFDTKVYYDRFNDHFILVSSLNGPSINSGMGVAVTQTNDPTGTWFRYTAASDPASTASAGHAIDYPTVGINKNWIVVDENVFNYSGSAFTTYYGQQIFVFDKAAAYANTLSSISLFEGQNSTCAGDSTDGTNLGCGFTMAPAITEDNTTDTEYMVEDWDPTAAQLRMSKITGTPSTPVLTVGTLFPQGTNSWRFTARRIGTTGGYAPQRQQAAYLVSGNRINTNDSRIQNCVLRSGSLWTTHTVMLSTVPQPAGTVVGGTSVGGTLTTRDNHSAVQWWQIDPTQETGLSNPTAVLQRGRIEDPTADNCHDGNGGTMTTGLCTSTGTQTGTFFAFPNISVNTNNDVLIGFTMFSAFTYPNTAYAIRLHTDAANTTRDPVVFHPGQANYNIGSGTGGTTSRNNRWGDYSGAQTDPLDDTTFWTVQEYAGTVRDFGIGLAGNWETWWAQVNPTAAAPSTSGNLIISEFRLRGPQGAGDEFVELYNPGASPVIVSTTDNSDGWALASNNGTTTVGMAVVPNGTVIPSHGHFLIARNPDAANGPTVTYSLNSYPGNQVRGADSDAGYSLDTGDTSGIAIFKTANTANFSALTLMDAAGPATLPVGSLFKEGTGLGPLPTSNLQYTLYRRLESGTPQDTNDNSTDFRVADTAGTNLPGLGQNLGAPGPENLDGPIQRNATFPAFLLDQSIAPSQGGSTPPNRVRDLTSNPGGNATFGTLSIRRRVVNNTGQAVTKLRFRVINVTTFPPSGALADVRALTSSDVTAAVNDPATCAASSLSAPCVVTVHGTTLEAPPTQANGGGWNSTVSVGFITLDAPLANGASVNVNLLLGIQATGTFRYILNIEAVP